MKERKGKNSLEYYQDTNMAGHGRSSIQIGSNRSIVDMKIGINPINSILLFYLKVPYHNMVFEYWHKKKIWHWKQCQQITISFKQNYLVFG